MDSIFQLLKDIHECEKRRVSRALGKKLQLQQRIFQMFTFVIIKLLSIPGRTLQAIRTGRNPVLAMTKIVRNICENLPNLGH